MKKVQVTFCVAASFFLVIGSVWGQEEVTPLPAEPVLETDEQIADADQPAAPLPQETVPDWKAEREQLASAAREKVIETITPQKVARDLGFDSAALRKPARTAEEIKAKVEREVNEAVDDKYPPKTAEDFAREAEAALPLWKVGDAVDLQTQSVRIPRITGEIRTIGATAIKIGDFIINTADLDEDMAARFYPDKLQELHKRYVRKSLLDFKAARVRYAGEITPEIAERHYGAAGYTEIKGDWQPKFEVVQRELSVQRREAFIETLKQFLAENNFVYFDNEWMPKDRAFFLDAVARAKVEPAHDRKQAILQDAIKKQKSSPFAQIARDYLAPLTVGQEGEARPPEHAGGRGPMFGPGEGGMMPPSAADMRTALELFQKIEVEKDGFMVDGMLGPPFKTEVVQWQGRPAESRSYFAAGNQIIEVILQNNRVVDKQMNPAPGIPPAGLFPPMNK